MRAASLCGHCNREEHAEEPAPSSDNEAGGRETICRRRAWWSAIRVPNTSSDSVSSNARGSASNYVFKEGRQTRLQVEPP